MKRTGKIVISLVMGWLLVFTAACAPTPEGAPTAPTPAPEKVTPTLAPGPAPTVGWGIIEIRVTDPPTANVTSAVVHLSKIEVHKVSDNVGEWIPIIDAPPSFDLMVVAQVVAILGSANVTAGSFAQIRMDVTKVEVVTAAGDNFTAEVPSDKLKIVGAFNVEGGAKTVLTLDFDGSKSLVVTGNGKALFKPVVKLLIEKVKSD